MRHAEELRDVLDWQVNYQLRSVPGVVEVNSFGGELRTYQGMPKGDEPISEQQARELMEKIVALAGLSEL
mgnify:CR=1 FL=1